MNIKFTYIVFFVLVGCLIRDRKEIDDFSIVEVEQYIQKAKQEKEDKNDREKLLDKVLNKILKSNNDSLNLKHLSTIAYEYLKLNDTISFKELTNKAMFLALKHKDSFVVGDTHWNFASYYNNLSLYDSAYYHFNTAQKYFKNYPYHKGRMLVGKAYIKSEFGDYLGSEEYAISALNIFKSLGESRQISNCYNHIGYIQKKIGNHNKSLFYYQKSLLYSKKSNSQEGKKLNIYNNIGTLYQEMGNYDKAISYFERNFSDNLEKSDIKNYARLLDNIHYTRLLNKDTTNVLSFLLKSLAIRESIQDKEGVVACKKHIGEYYLFSKDTLKFKMYTISANQLAKKNKSADDYLTTLIMLAKTDKKGSAKYLQKYINYKDSLQKAQFEFQNVFARISYETDEYIQETHFLKKRQRYLIILAFGMITIISLLYILKREHAKNQKLLFDAEQQKLNEELYILALKRQEKFEEVKSKERNRISEELHDGVLSRLFGIRVGFDFLKITSSKETKTKYDQLIIELQNIEKEIRNLSHRLSVSYENSVIDFGILIEELLKSKGLLGNFEYAFKNDEALLWDKVSYSIKVNLYRIIQEALQNIIKHSNATFVIITSELTDNYIKIIIEDNGKGFDVSKDKKGIGLKNMKSRANKIGGEFYILSSISEGTKIILSLPLQKKL